MKAYALIRDVGLSLAAPVISGASGLTGWIGQVGWGAASDHRGRKFSLYILAIGGVITLLAMIFIQNVALAWIIHTYRMGPRPRLAVPAPVRGGDAPPPTPPPPGSGR